MKKVLVVLLIVVAGVMAFAGQYQWGGTPVIGNKIATWESIMDTTLVTSRGLSLPYFVAVTPNHKAWVAGYGANPRANRTIWVYDAEFEVVDSIPADYQWDGVDYLMGSTRFGQTTGDGNVAYANWGPEFITVFDQDDYSVVAQSPWCNTSGGMEAFVYNGEQYYITQQILAAHITLWDEDFNIIDTLWGGGGGRNLACTSDGSVIIAPSLGGTYFMEYAGNPVDGYTGPDTITLEDLGILNTGDRTAGGMGNLMYVSRGPNDYIWLMSRDAAVDGVYVVDPKNDYEVKL
ncbi:MAG: hypothetical protein K0B52_02090, partial [FCB group bacterium]|nr:hypothetical protein [FCB group bacterium]